MSQANVVPRLFTVKVVSPRDRPRFSRQAEISRQTLERLGFEVHFNGTYAITNNHVVNGVAHSPSWWDVAHTTLGPCQSQGVP